MLIIRFVLWNESLRTAAKSRTLPAVDTDFSFSQMKMSENLTAQMNGTQALSFFNRMHEATRIGLTFYHCLIFVVSLIGNIIIGIIVYRTKSMQNPSNFFIANMAMSDLTLPIFHFPYFVTKINFGWLTSGPLGQALCKLVFFLPCVDSEPGFNCSGSIWSSIFSPPFLTHQFKAVLVLHTRHLDHWCCCSYPRPAEL